MKAINCKVITAQRRVLRWSPTRLLHRGKPLLQQWNIMERKAAKPNRKNETFPRHQDCFNRLSNVAQLAKKKDGRNWYSKRSSQWNGTINAVLLNSSATNSDVYIYKPIKLPKLWPPRHTTSWAQEAITFRRGFFFCCLLGIQYAGRPGQKTYLWFW